MTTRREVLKFINEFIEETSLSYDNYRLSTDESIQDLIAWTDDCSQDFLMVIDGQYGVYIDRWNDLLDEGLSTVSDFIDYIIENMEE